jgi:hypothetical protein
VALDFSTPPPIQEIPLKSVNSSNKTLEKADGNMLTLKSFNEDILLSFQAPPPCREGIQRSLFVRGTGFYTFAASVDGVKSSKKAINLSEYSRRKWQAYCKIKI